MKQLAAAGVLMLIVIISAKFVYASVSMGSVQIDDVKTVYAGNGALFRVGFFNIHNERPVEIRFSVKAPRGWDVSINPESIVVPRSYVSTSPQPRDGYATLKTRRGYLNAKIVSLSVDVPRDQENGKYEILLYANTIDMENKTMGVSQSRVFRFYVNAIAKNKKQRSENGNGATANVETDSEKGGEDVFVIDYNRNRKERENKSKKTEQGKERNDIINDVTGMVISSPAPQVAILVVLLCLLFVLKFYKKI